MSGPKDLEPSYHQLTEGLQQGPRMKGHATQYFEKVMHAFLDPTAKVECRYNMLGELEVSVQSKTKNETYNLTKILEHHPDFEQISFTDKQIKQYENFFLHKFENEKKAVLTRKDYAKSEGKDKNRLQYGEKLATTLYTTNFYQEINSFLRKFGRFDVDAKSQNAEELSLYVKEVTLAAALTSHGLSKPEQEKSDDDEKALTIEAILAQNAEDLKTHAQFSTETLYRGEKIHNFSGEKRFEQKLEAIENKIPLNQSGLTSTSKEDSVAKDFLKLGSPGRHEIITEIEQPQAKNPLGKDVSKLSAVKKESEVLYPHGTQFLYYKHEAEYQNSSVLSAIPVRTIEGIDPFSYSHSEMKVRTNLIHAREELNKFEFKYGQDNAVEELVEKMKMMLDQAITDFDSKADNQKSKAEKIAQLSAIRESWVERIKSVADESVKKSFNEFSKKFNFIFVDAFLDPGLGLTEASTPKQMRMLTRISISQLSNSENLKSDDVGQFINAVSTHKELYETAAQSMGNKDSKNKTDFHKIIEKSPVHTLKLVDVFLQNANNLPLVLQVLAERGDKNKTRWISLGDKSTRADKQNIADLVSSAVKKLNVTEAKELLQEIKAAEFNKTSPYYGLYEKWNILGLVAIKGKTKLFRQLMDALEDHCKHGASVSEKSILLDNSVLTKTHAEDNTNSYDGLNHTGLFHPTTTWQKAKPKEMLNSKDGDSDGDRENPENHHFENH